MIEVIRAARSIIPATEITFLSLHIYVFILKAFFTRNLESSQLWSASLEVWACSFGVVYNLGRNLNFVIRMSKQFEKI